jgi:predicted PurR-regulated permease PerM
LHVKYALLIGVVAGIFDIIPFVGAFVGAVPAVALAFFNDGWQHALIVAIVFVLIFQAEGHFIAPRIVSESVGLSPLTVIVAILIGGELHGIGGMFLAVPIAAALRVILIHALPRSDTPVPVVEPLAAAKPPVTPRRKARSAQA